MIWIITTSVIALIVICIACILAHKWYYAYCSIRKRYQKLQSENIRLQHEVYKLSYNVPTITKGKREK